jgi:plasmid stability protein
VAQLVLKDLSDGVLEALKRRAERKGASLEDEARDILIAAATPDRETFMRWLMRFRSEQSAQSANDSVELLRRDRMRGG